MHHIECPVLVQKEHSAIEAYSMIVSTPEENTTSDSTKIAIKCRIASCAVQAMLADRSKLSGEMTTFGVADPQSCARNESPIEPDIKVHFQSAHSENF